MKEKNWSIAILVLAFSLLYSASIAASDTDNAVRSVMEWMIEVIAPNSDILWNVEEPLSAENWQAYGLAAAAIVEASTAIAEGARSLDGELWSNEAAWQDLNTLMKQAAMQAKIASETKDLDKLYEAGDALYPPCESCHLQFNPGVIQQQ